MRRWFGALMAAAALGGAASLPAAPAKKAAAPSRQDWARSVAVTPEGGYRMGNPQAAVKVVEYGSLTCPTCAAFSNSAKAPLAARVRTGKVSFEFRNFVLNGVDVTASLLARCAAPGGFFPLLERIYSTQGQWTAKFSGLSQAQQQKISALPEAQRLVGVADAAGLTQLAAQGGVPAAKAKACLTDPARLTRLGKMHEAATALGVQGTPTFFVNGAKVHAHDWAELDAEIRKAGG
jgi:protein-disulfide isomerase